MALQEYCDHCGTDFIDTVRSEQSNRLCFLCVKITDCDREACLHGKKKTEKMKCSWDGCQSTAVYFFRSSHWKIGKVWGACYGCATPMMKQGGNGPLFGGHRLYSTDINGNPLKRGLLA